MKALEGPGRLAFAERGSLGSLATQGKAAKENSGRQRLQECRTHTKRSFRPRAEHRSVHLLWHRELRGGFRVCPLGSGLALGIDPAGHLSVAVRRLGTSNVHSTSLHLCGEQPALRGVCAAAVRLP